MGRLNALEQRAFSPGVYHFISINIQYYTDQKQSNLVNQKDKNSVTAIIADDRPALILILVQFEHGGKHK